MIKLTPRQEQILDYIKEYLAETGFPPTRSEIAKEMGFKSPNAAEEHLRALARKGAIEMMAWYLPRYSPAHQRTTGPAHYWSGGRRQPAAG